MVAYSTIQIGKAKRALEIAIRKGKFEVIESLSEEVLRRIIETGRNYEFTPPEAKKALAKIKNSGPTRSSSQGQRDKAPIPTEGASNEQSGNRPEQNRGAFGSGSPTVPETEAARLRSGGATNFGSQAIATLILPR